MKEYTFKYQNTKAGVYFLLGFIGAPFLLLFPTVFLINKIPWIFWISIPLMIGVMIYSILTFIKKSRSIDTITVDNEGFTSANYGRIHFSEINSIPPYGIFQAPPPSMRIRLKNGKKISWILDANNQKSKQDAITFVEFREELLRNLRKSAQTSSSTSPSIQTSPTSVNHESSAKQPEKTNQFANAVIEQLEENKKRDIKYKYIAIPVGLAFGLLYFVRTCGEDLIRNHKNSEMDVIRQGFVKMETDYEDNISKAKEVAAEYTKKLGPLFLYTNDPVAEMQFLPNFDYNPYMPKLEVIGLRHSEDNKQLEKFIQHPDSASYSLTVTNPSIHYLTTMTESVFSEKDSTAVNIYFALYNPKETLPSNYRMKEDTTFHPIEYNTSIGIPKSGRITNDVLKNMDFASVRSIIQTYKGTYFYMAAKENDDISKERFDELIKLLKDNFKENNISTVNFETKVFNKD